MGFFDWLAEKARDVVDAIKDFFGIGSSSSYSGSVREAVDVGSVLHDFKKSISEDVEKQEKAGLNVVIAEFDRFKEKNNSTFPELSDEVEKREREVIQHLDGVMMKHIETRLSANDAEFRKVLEMQPGEEKRKSLEKYANKFIQEAERKFKEKLEVEMNTLQKEVGMSFTNELDKRKDDLVRKEEACQALQCKAENGDLNLKELEDDCIPAEDALRCAETLFDMEPRGELL